jgi:hydrogenase/urease accessory protein HupE
MSAGSVLRWAWLVTLLGLLIAPRLARAHALNPALLQLEEDRAGLVRVTWKVTVSETTVDDFAPVLPGCQDASPRVSTHVGVGVVSAWAAQCKGGLAGSTVGVQGLSNRSEEALLRIALADGRHFTTVLRATAPSFTVPTRPGRVAMLQSYVRLGAEHIAAGADHLAFVLGLMLLIGYGRRLLAAITSFTVAHSVTLALASLGLVRVPSALTEVLIALSILFLAVEVARPADRRSPITARWPWAIAFAFGLLHGFGFAGALAEIGLPAGEIPEALLAFNVGVEAGQIAFVVAVCAAVSLGRVALRRLAPLQAPRRVVAEAFALRASGWVIGVSAAYWTFDRILSL